MRGAPHQGPALQLTQGPWANFQWFQLAVGHQPLGCEHEGVKGESSPNRFWYILVQMTPECPHSHLIFLNVFSDNNLPMSTVAERVA